VSELEVGLLRSRVATSLRASVWPVLLIGVVVALAATTKFAAVMAMMPLALLGGIFLAIRSLTKPRPVIGRGRLVVRGDRVLVGGRALTARTSITSGAVVPTAPEGVVVRLERRRGLPIDLHAGDVDRAREILEALELDPKHAVARFHALASDAGAWQRRMRLMIPVLVLFGAAVAISARVGLPILIPFHAFLMVALALSMVVPAQVTVGTDGISFRRFGRGDFISLDGVADAFAVDTDTTFNATLCVVRLIGDDGSVVRELVVDQKKHGPFSEGIHRAVDARANALAARIREVIYLRRARDNTFNPRTLARRERELHEWLHALRSLLTRTTGFRDEEPPTPEALLAIVEDGSAAAIDRAAAAIALSQADDAIKQRVRVAADATAAPRLRVALEAAIDQDEQKLASALEEIERAREA